MTLRDDLRIVREYFQYIAESDADPLACNIDGAVMLYYVKGDSVLLKCTFCDHSLYPGTRLLNKMQSEVLEWKKSSGMMSE